MAQPVCDGVGRILGEAVTSLGGALRNRLHSAGTYVCIEGPHFSSLAESQLYRSMGADVIGMTNMPEAKLAREAQIAYATMAMVTDYDCWHPHEADVSADLALRNLMENSARAQRIIAEAVGRLGRELPPSIAHTLLSQALVTQPDHMPPERRAALAPFFAGSD